MSSETKVNTTSESSAQNNKKIVIIGAGFGGIYALFNLKKSPQFKNFHVTLINSSNYFLFTPLIHEVATGGLDRQNVITPLKSILPKENVDFIQDYVDLIDVNSRNVKTKTGREFQYDYLIIATGAKSNYFNIDGAESNTLTLKNLRDAEKIKNNVVDAIENGSRSLNFVIVGGGPTGVELAAEMSELVYGTFNKYHPEVVEKAKIYLLNGSPNLISQFRPENQKYVESQLKKMHVEVINNCEISEVTENKVISKDGNEIESEHIIWTTGVKPNTPQFSGEVKVDVSDRIVVNKFLQIPNHKEVFVLGDVASGYPMDAQTAVDQAVLVAKNIYLMDSNQPLTPYKYRPLGKLLSLGRKNAVGEIGPFNLHGWHVWFLWRTVYLVKMISWKKKIQVAINWTFNLFTPRDIACHHTND